MLCFTWSNFTVRVATLVLSLSYLGTLWTSPLVIIALILAAILLHHSTVPPRFQKFTTWVLSLTTTTLVVENISRRERGRDNVRSAEEKKRIRRCLARQSLLNLAVFSLYSGLMTWLITDHKVSVNSNNILSPGQLLPIFLYFFLPFSLVNLLSCLNILLLPASSKSRLVQAASAVLSLTLFTFTLVQPIMAGVYLVPASPRDVFILSKVRDSLSIYTATTYTSHSWDLDQAWTYNTTRDSLMLNTIELFLTETSQTGDGRLVLSRDLTKKDRAVLEQGKVYITARLNPINWPRKEEESEEEEVEGLIR